MKKRILNTAFTLALCIAGSQVNAQWDITTFPGTKMFPSPTSQLIGIGHNNPVLDLDVSGTTNLWSGYRWAAINGKMQPGSLTIGNLNTNFGGGSSLWTTTNLAQLLFECADNTEIAVHDEGARVASLMYYDGLSNRIEIGRNKGWGYTTTLATMSKLGVGTLTPSHTLTVNGNLLVDGSNSYLAFRENSSNTNGEWAIEYDVNGLNFWKPYPTAGFGNYFLFLKDDGNIGIGTNTPAYKLDVCGTIRAKELRVEIGWCDYVFEKDYKLMPLSSLSNFIAEKKHLPEIPSQKEIEKDGLKVAEMQALHMKKIEELTLYILELHKRIEVLEKQAETPKN